jgi:hypothetical protein
MGEWKICSLCLDKITITDFTNNRYYNVSNDVVCDECFCLREFGFFWCDRCCEFDYKQNNYVETKDIYDNIIYYHNKCLFEPEKCPICEDYLKNKECIDVRVDRNCKVNKYHKSCVEFGRDIYYEHNVCKYCNVSLRVKCVNCTHRFNDCYNENCESYITNEDECEEPGRYDGRCRSCNW